MHYNPIKVHYREEREHQENGIDEKKQDKSNDPNNANIQANNSYNELMTNIRVRSKTSLEASQEDNKSKGCYLYDLDIEQNMKITSKHEIITP